MTRRGERALTQNTYSVMAINRFYLTMAIDRFRKSMLSYQTVLEGDLCFFLYTGTLLIIYSGTHLVLVFQKGENGNQKFIKKIISKHVLKYVWFFFTVTPNY